MDNVLSEEPWSAVMDPGSVVAYADSEKAWRHYDEFLRDLIESRGYRTICEVGGGANPTFSEEFVSERGLDYVIMDVSQEELDKAPSVYRKVCADIVGSVVDGEGRFDLVFSKMLAEHVQSGERFHRNVARLLRPGGIAVHFFPTLFAPPFVLNTLLPERLAESILHMIQAGRERSGKRAKFPAYYSWCRGPRREQIARLERLGYKVEKYIGFFGHAGYYRKLPLIERAHVLLAKWLVRHPIPAITSFAWVVLRKTG